MRVKVAVVLQENRDKFEETKAIWKCLVARYSINPYVGCTHSCKYCYACFMKRFTRHTEEWGTFFDVKMWKKIKNPKKYKGQTMIIGSVTDGYNQYEEIYHKKNLSYWETLDKEVEQYAKDNGFMYVIDEEPFLKNSTGKPIIINYFYHEKIRQSSKNK